MWAFVILIVLTTVLPSQSDEGDNPLMCCKDSNISNGKSNCEPIPDNETTLVKTGRKAIDKCIEYLELVYPCLDNVRTNKCGLGNIPFLPGSVEASPDGFPHIALLGFKDNSSGIHWGCSAALISDFYLLTSGHCTYNRDYFNVTWALLAAYKKNLNIPELLYRIVTIIKHPDYKPARMYYDIALLKLDRKVIFTENLRPACLPIDEQIENESNYIATRYTIDEDKYAVDSLLTMTVLPITHEDCAKKYPISRRIREGISKDQHICAGNSWEACEYGPGGLLQVDKPKIYCMYDVIGVGIFNGLCVDPAQPALYTRVSHYTPWIERTIWP